MCETGCRRWAVEDAIIPADDLSVKWLLCVDDLVCLFVCLFLQGRVVAHGGKHEVKCLYVRACVYVCVYV